MTDPFWTSAFLDLAPDDVGAGAAYWSALTGFDPSAVADLSREFPPLAPLDGDPYLWVQRVGDAPSRIHLDLHVDDVDAATKAATAAGGVLVDRRDHAVLRSPSGFAFCLVADRKARVPSAVTWPGGHCSRVDRLHLVVPDDAYDAEEALWRHLAPTEPHALDLVVERGNVPAPHAELSFATSDRPAEVVRHQARGGLVVLAEASHTGLVDPVGIRYRIAEGAQ